jgi:hypothetical protein
MNEDDQPFAVFMFCEILGFDSIAKTLSKEAANLLIEEHNQQMVDAMLTRIASLAGYSCSPCAAKGKNYLRSKRSRFITFSQAATKSFTKAS